MNRIQRNGLTRERAERVRDKLIQYHPFAGVGVGRDLESLGDASDLAYLVDLAIEHWDENHERDLSRDAQTGRMSA